MKRITVNKVQTLLKTLNTDESTAELLLNNISLYNTLLREFQAGERHNVYLLYQLNNAIQKEIEGLKKLNKKLKDDNIDDDTFNTIIKAVKKSQPAAIKGFLNKNVK
jgi:oligoribonuclease NrnB/cAMP/cGMP phosphodiesterase (DHH superfamily)